MRKIFRIAARSKCLVLYGLMVAAIIAPAATSATPLDHPRDIDALVQRVMERYRIPGAAIAVFKGQDVIYAGTFGERLVGAKGNITPHTLFKTGSNSKAFTAAALAILVSEGKISWTDKIKQWIPEFQTSSAAVTDALTVEDVLTHRFGIDPAASELFLWPDRNDYTMRDLLSALPAFPIHDFRSKFNYDNLGYVLAGEVVARVSGMTYADFVKQKIFAPLGLTGCALGPYANSAAVELAQPHAVVDGALAPVRVDGPMINTALLDPAGGIRCDLLSSIKWLQYQLQVGPGRLNISPAVFSQMHQAHIDTPISDFAKTVEKTSRSAYGYGWQVNDIDGLERFDHLGGVSGMYSAYAMLPAKQTGIVILTNQQSAAARTVLLTMLTKMVTAPSEDWLSYLEKTFPPGLDRTLTRARPIARAGVGSLSRVEGIYQDQLYGGVIICRNERAQMGIRFAKSPYMDGLIDPDNLGVAWSDPAVHSNATVIAVDSGATRKLRLLPDPDSDFTFSAVDLQWQRACPSVQKSHRKAKSR
jgi:CubicO group peptidase (beta-lactamase class C family)